MQGSPSDGGRVLVARTGRDVVTATGPDAIAFLQGQISQDLADLAVGDVTWSFVLQPQGKVDAWFRLRRTADDGVTLDLDPGWGGAALTRLERFKLRTRCDFGLSEDVPTVAVRGLALAGGLACGWPGLDGSDHLGSHDDPPGLPARAVELDDDAYRALRMAHGVPAMGAELTEATIPAEAGQWLVDASVSFTKGCFTGQELVARIDSRGGKVPRHLRGFTTDALPPAPGTALHVDGAAVGEVTGAAIGLDGGTVGLAYVKRAVEPPAVAVLDDGSSAMLFAVPPG